MEMDEPLIPFASRRCIGATALAPAKLIALMFGRVVLFKQPINLLHVQARAPVMVPSRRPCIAGNARGSPAVTFCIFAARSISAIMFLVRCGTRHAVCTSPWNTETINLPHPRHASLNLPFCWGTRWIVRHGPYRALQNRHSRQSGHTPCHQRPARKYSQRIHAAVGVICALAIASSFSALVSERLISNALIAIRKCPAL